jgi:hypothetical protein
LLQGNDFSHASPFARIMESGECARLLQFGVRTLNPVQRAQRARFDVRSMDAASWADSRAELWVWLAMGGNAIKCPSPRNVLKDTCDQRCY